MNEAPGPKTFYTDEYHQIEKSILQLNRLYATFSRIYQVIVTVRDRDEMFRKICSIAVEFGTLQMAWFGLVDPSGQFIIPVAVARKVPVNLNKDFLLTDEERTMCPVVPSILEGKCIFCMDIASDPRMLSGRAEADKKGFHSSVTVPVRQNTMVIGAFTTYSRETMIFDEKELQLFEEIGLAISFALDTIEAEKQRNKSSMELIIAKEKAEENDRLKTAFLHNISHEIRTPINAIIGFSGLLNKTVMKPEEQRNYLDIIVRSSHQLLSIITNIVNIATVESGQEKVVEKDINLNSMLRQLCDQFTLNAKRQNISLNLEKVIPDNEASITTDETKLKEILDNLMGNALKFTERGSIDFGYEIKGEFVEFHIKDTGVGIPPDKQVEIFKRFYQIDVNDESKFRGFGLGLSISKAYVELLGGQIWLTSTPGKGSEFFFTIPYKKAVFKGLKENQNTPVVTDVSEFLGTLLIVEDEDLNFMLLEKFFSGIYIKIIRVRNGLEAVNACKSNPQIDIVLMDLKMPVMNGYESTKKIKETCPGLPIIVQTAYVNDTDKNKVLECGCSEVISKPIDLELLLSKIRLHLNKSE
jgi:signal transduction histidine kinase